MYRWFIILFAFAFHGSAGAQLREKISINSGWQFVLKDAENSSSLIKETSFKRIHLPHTWNAKDILDETPGFHRGIGWYQRSLFISDEYKDKMLSLYFEGACNKTTVFINGQEAGVHNGGYTGFSIPITSFIKMNDSNLVWVKVDNSKHLSDSIPPFSGDFNLMGGIYRDAWLIVTNPVHFGGEAGSSGIQFSTSVISERKAEFSINAFLKGIRGDFKGSVSYQLLKDGKETKKGGKPVLLNGDGEVRINGSIDKPALWSPETPELYQLILYVRNEKQQVLDEITMNVGFRWFGISSKQEFLLNGKSYKLKGASRHQDYDGIGNALTDEMHWRDIQLMKDMGCNFLRIAHYPQDPAIYDACDKIGMLTWSEIPVVDKVISSEAFHRNCEAMMKEMVLQNYNHPSVAMWGYHNEVRNLDTATLTNATRLNRIAKQMDPHRLTAMAFETNLANGYYQNPLVKDILGIADIIGYNVYEGWYSGSIKTVPDFLQTLHQLYPAKPMLLSEYGAGSSIGIHTNSPTIFDFSEEYQCLFQEPYLEEGKKHPWMIGWGIWNFIDFQRDDREDVQPNINNKGMVTTTRQPKDVYYYYKAQWSKEPFVYISGKNWKDRVFFTNDKTVEVIIVVYSNQDKLLLYTNGRLATLRSSKNGKYIFNVTLSGGSNQLLCKTADEKLSDILLLNCRFISPSTFSKIFPGAQISFNTGQTRTFYTTWAGNETWIPDKAYAPGTWGYVNGKIYSSWPGNKFWDGIREGIHKPVMLTNDEPVYQTFVEGLTDWKADVPDGSYRVSLLLCEPFTSVQRKNEQRIIDLKLNDQVWVNGLNIEKEYGILTAVTLDKEVIIKNGRGITVSFVPRTGRTILNGIRIQKL